MSGTECLSCAPGSHYVCTIRTPLGVDRKLYSSNVVFVSSSPMASRSYDNIILFFLVIVTIAKAVRPDLRGGWGCKWEDFT